MLELARPEDREAVNQMALQMHQQHVAWRPDLFEMVPEVYSAERFQSAIDLRQLYVAKLNHIVVGYALLRIQKTDETGMISSKVMNLDAFCVHASCCGQGIGTMMMQDIHALAKAFRCTDLQLHVYPQNDDAVGFYQKCGFTIRSIDMQKRI